MNPHWKIFASKTIVLEKKYVILLSEVIQNFRSSFIADLTTHGKDYATHRLHLTPLHDKLTTILQDIYREAGLLGAKITAAEIKKAARLKSAGFGINEQWIQDVLNFLRLHLLKFVANITETMRQDIINVLDKSVSEGWSIAKTVEELQRKDVMEARAQVIARTEIIRAANVGHSVAARRTPYEVEKKWLAAADHRTRESHQIVGGNTTTEDGLFKVPIFQKGSLVGYDEMLYPGDATASPGNTINCRCRALYLPKRDANGRLILRSSNTATIIPIRTPSIGVPAHQIAAALKANIFVGIRPEGETKR